MKPNGEGERTVDANKKKSTPSALAIFETKLYTRPLLALQTQARQVRMLRLCKSPLVFRLLQNTSFFLAFGAARCFLMII
jgi:hypothetical protein